MPLRRLLLYFLVSAAVLNINYLPFCSAKDTGSVSKEDDLLAAIKRRDTKKAADLIKKGADLNAADKSGKTALMWAARRGNKEIVNLLLSRLAIANKKDKAGGIALMYALEGYRETSKKDPAAADYLEIIKALLLRCDDVNCRDRYYNTNDALLMYAVRAICPDAVKFLLSHGAQVNYKNREGQTALEMAEKIYIWDFKYSKTFDSKPALTEIIDMLKKAGGRYDPTWETDFKKEE